MDGIFTSGEAKVRAMEARERVVRAERKLGDLEAAGKSGKRCPQRLDS